jgi:hypothetical protein
VALGNAHQVGACAGLQRGSEWLLVYGESPNHPPWSAFSPKWGVSNDEGATWQERGPLHLTDGEYAQVYPTCLIEDAGRVYCFWDGRVDEPIRMWSVHLSRAGPDLAQWTEIEADIPRGVQTGYGALTNPCVWRDERGGFGLSMSEYTGRYAWRLKVYHAPELTGPWALRQVIEPDAPWCAAGLWDSRYLELGGYRLLLSGGKATGRLLNFGYSYEDDAGIWRLGALPLFTMPADVGGRLVAFTRRDGSARVYFDAFLNRNGTGEMRLFTFDLRRE